MAKAPDAFRTISEVAEQLETPAHVLRFWESKFIQVKPVKRAGGRRYYRPDDVALLGGIKALLHDQGMTIKGAQKILREQGVRAVMAVAPSHATGGNDDTLDLPPAAEDTAPPPTPVATPPVDDPHPAPADLPDDLPDAAEEVTASAMTEAPEAELTEAAETEAEPAPDTIPSPAPLQPDNIVTLPFAPQPEAHPQQAAALHLPPDPAPRPVTGPRVLGLLALADHAALRDDAARLQPLHDRLLAALTRMTEA